MPTLGERDIATSGIRRQWLARSHSPLHSEWIIAVIIIAERHITAAREEKDPENMASSTSNVRRPLHSHTRGMDREYVTRYCLSCPLQVPTVAGSPPSFATLTNVPLPLLCIMFAFVHKFHSFTLVIRALLRFHELRTTWAHLHSYHLSRSVVVVFDDDWIACSPTPLQHSRV